MKRLCEKLEQYYTGDAICSQFFTSVAEPDLTSRHPSQDWTRSLTDGDRDSPSSPSPAEDGAEVAGSPPGCAAPPGRIEPSSPHLEHTAPQ